MDLLISPLHFFGILAECNILLVENSDVSISAPNFEGSLHMEVHIPSKPYSILTLQIRENKIIYNKILEWKLATHYRMPNKALRSLKEHCTRAES